MLKIFYCIAVLLVFFITAGAQDSATCEVKMGQLKGKYSGDCVKGKANGQGTASGIDTYEGGFKNGLPDGEGKYTWQNGSVYSGTWKKGVKEGKGEMSEMLPNGLVKFKKGFWKKDEYRGEHENPYIVHTSSSEINRTEFSYSKSKNEEGTVRIEIKNGTGQGTTIVGSSAQGTNGPGTGTVIKMTGFRILNGIFLNKTTNALTNSEITTFRNVQFPFRAVLYFDNRTIDFEIFNPGSWDIALTANR